MGTLLKASIIPGAVGGAFGGLLWALRHPGDLTESPVPFVRESALILFICVIMGVIIGFVFHGVAGLVLRLRKPEDSRDMCMTQAWTALVLSGGAWMTVALVRPGLPLQIAMVAGATFLVIAAFALLRVWRAEKPGHVQMARWLGIFAGSGFFVLWLRAVRTGAAPLGVWDIIVIVPAAAAIGYLFWYCMLALLKILAARTSPGWAVGALTLALILPIVGLTGWAVASATRVDFDRQLAKIPQSSADPAQPNIILISVDTLRADAVGYAGGKTRTPTIDAMAEESYIFERAYSVAPWTRPSFAAFFSSRYPSEMGVARIQGGPREAVPHTWREDRQLLGEVFREEGYTSAAVMTNPNLTREARADQGFDFFYHCSVDAENVPKIIHDFAQALYEPDPTFVSKHKLERAHRVSSHAVKLINENDNRPKLFWVHYMDPHQPYDPPSLAEARRIVPNLYASQGGAATVSAPERQKFLSAYRGEVEYCDRWLQRVIKELKASGLWDSSIVVFWSDHGEEFWEHEGWEHGQSLFNELLHVPLLIHLPGQTQSRRINRNVSLLDVMPTLLDYCDAPAPTKMKGRSLLDLMQGKTETRHNFEVLLEGCLYGGLRKGLLTDRWKLIYDVYHDEFSLYDMANDPREKHDLHGTALAPDTAHMEQRLLEWTEESQVLMREYVSTQENVELSPDIQQNLKDMGYIQ